MSYFWLQSPQINYFYNDSLDVNHKLFEFFNFGFCEKQSKYIQVNTMVSTLLR
jgi:hypothetical protein